MIQWFPGHMAKAIRQIEELKKIIDIFIVVLDARAPLSTYNQEFDKTIGGKNKLFVLSKFDLSDHQKINKIIKFLPSNQGVISLNLKNQKSYKKITNKIKIITKSKISKNLNKGVVNTNIKIAILGMPNVGKSTLINLLAKKQKMKVANIPGVTRAKQWINTGEMFLLDTPGILMPKINDEKVAIKLATIGLIKDIIINRYDLLTKSYRLISEQYPQKIIFLNLIPSTNAKVIFEQLKYFCQTKHFYLKNKELDIKRAEIFLLNYFKNLIGVTYD